jgi:hypothetical protein
MLLALDRMSNLRSLGRRNATPGGTMKKQDLLGTSGMAERRLPAFG